MIAGKEYEKEDQSVVVRYKKIIVFLLLTVSTQAYAHVSCSELVSHINTTEYKKLVNHVQTLLNQGITQEEIIDVVIEEKSFLDGGIIAVIVIGCVAGVVALGVLYCVCASLVCNEPHTIRLHNVAMNPTVAALQQRALMDNGDA